MSNTQDILTNLGDEALDSPTHEAFGANCGYCGFCFVSDEVLDPAPAQEAGFCMPSCWVSDEPLDHAPAKAALTCCIFSCRVSDEVLDPAPAQEAGFCMPSCWVSDEPLDHAPAKAALTCCIFSCRISDEALDPTPVVLNQMCGRLPCTVGSIGDEAHVTL